MSTLWSVWCLWSLIFGSPAFYAIAIMVSLVGWVVYQRHFSPLAGVPGPFLASISRLWYLRRIFAGDMHHCTKALHKKYGPLVRIAPDEVSCSEPRAMKLIYAVNAGFTKTDWYSTLAANTSPHGDSFSQLDEKKHAYRRRMINKVFSMSSILESETYMDNVTAAFFRRMSEFADSEGKVDMSEWLQFYASDVMCELFFGRSFGYVEEARDIGGYIYAVDAILPVAVKMGVLPAWIRPLKVLIYPFSAGFRLAISRVKSLAAASKRYVDERVSGKSIRTDLLEKLLAVCKDKTPDFDITDVYTEAYTALFAGSDTVACAMRSVIYHLCRNPNVYEKLLAEIDSFHQAGMLSEFITYAEVLKMPYTVATIKEAKRVHPSAALTYPRHVPKGGTAISGYFFPEGSKVGVNPYVLHYNTSIFGLDAEDFNPDRWFRLEAAIMERFMFQFGSGPRICIGKNIAIAELYKFVPQFLRAFEVKLAEPEQEWIEKNVWFVKQTGIDCWVSKREKRG